MVLDFLRGKRPDWRTQWRESVEAYAGDINTYVTRGFAEGWDGLNPPEEPNIPQDMPGKALAALRISNAMQPVQRLTEIVPPNHFGLLPLIEKKGQRLDGALLLDDGRILFRVGAAWQGGRMWELSGEESRPLDDLLLVGRSPDGRYFAEANADGFRLTDGWQGEVMAELPWPDRAGGMPPLEDVVYDAEDGPFPLDQLLVFPDGHRVMLVSTEGIYIVTEAGAHRVYPSDEEVVEFVDYGRDAGESPVEYSPSCDMAYGAISADGRFFTAGHQSSQEVIFDARTLQPVGSVRSFSEYPHHAGFTQDGEYVFSNACHFYIGHSVCVPTRLLSPDKTLEATDGANPNAEGISQFDEGARIYAATSHGDTFYYGDATGYIHARRTDGTYLWRRFIGSSFSSLDISKDGKTLIAATYAGFLVEFALDGDAPRPFEIGTDGAPREIRRWVVWRDEPKPLLWH